MRFSQILEVAAAQGSGGPAAPPYVGPGTGTVGITEFINDISGNGSAFLSQVQVGQRIVTELNDMIATGVASNTHIDTMDVGAVNESTVPYQIANVGSEKEITTIDFGSMTGADFVTAGAGLGFLISGFAQRYGVWFNTGTETQPTLSGATAYVEVTILDVDSANGMAIKLANALVSGLGSVFVDTALVGGLLTIQDFFFGARTDASAATSGLTLIVTQQGVS